MAKPRKPILKTVKVKSVLESTPKVVAPKMVQPFRTQKNIDKVFERLENLLRYNYEVRRDYGPISELKQRMADIIKSAKQSPEYKAYAKSLNELERDVGKVVEWCEETLKGAKTEYRLNGYTVEVQTTLNNLINIMTKLKSERTSQNINQVMLSLDEIRNEAKDILVAYTPDPPVEDDDDSDATEDDCDD